MGEFLFLCQSHLDDILTLYTILNSTDFYSLLVLGNELQTVLWSGVRQSDFKHFGGVFEVGNKGVGRRTLRSGAGLFAQPHIKDKQNDYKTEK